MTVFVTLPPLGSIIFSRYKPAFSPLTSMVFSAIILGSISLPSIVNNFRVNEVPPPWIFKKSVAGLGYTTIRSESNSGTSKKLTSQVSFTIKDQPTLSVHPAGQSPPLMLKLTISSIKIISHTSAVTPLGSVIGALWGFIDFAIGGAIAAWLYQKIKK